MEVMYTDVNRLPQGSLEKYSIDLELGGDNDFELQMNVKNHCMSAGCIWYVKDEEYGGIVDDVKVDTEKSKVYYSGRSGGVSIMTVEEALAASVVEPVNDIFEIDPETRVITVPASEKLFGVANDGNSERKHFRCPKIVGDNIDLSLLLISP